MLGNLSYQPSVGVVGGGIVGLATAYALLQRQSPPSVTVLEKESVVGGHQTTHNSGVVHAGIYYAPGSLKSELCRRGADLMAEYCIGKGLAYDRCGKLIVALEPEELPRLEALFERGVANGVPGLRLIGAEELREFEPAAHGIAAIHSATTAIVDYSEVAASLAKDIVAAGGVVRTGAEVVDIEDVGSQLAVWAEDEIERFDFLLVCAGAQSDRLAYLTGAPVGPRIIPFRGGYLRLRPERRGLVRSMIYPVPDPRFPFLGVHFTRRVDGEILVGPSAFLAAGREVGAPLSQQAKDLLSSLGWPGLWRFLPSHLVAGGSEALSSISRRRYTRAAQRYIPALSEEDTLPGPYGIRAQAMYADGRLEDDFLIASRGRVLHVRNAPSPAATSSLAIGQMLATAVPARSTDPLRSLRRPGGD